MTDKIDYKKELNKYKKKAQDLLKDNEKLDKVILDAEEKLKSIPKLGDTLSYIPVFIDMVKCYISGEYKEIPTGTLISVCAVLLYFISPIDIIPDVIPILGYMDDAAIVAAALVLVKSDLDIFINWRKKKPITVTAKPKKAVKKVVKKIETKTAPIKKEIKKAKVKHDVKKAEAKVKKEVKKVKNNAKKTASKVKKAVNKAKKTVTK